MKKILGFVLIFFLAAILINRSGMDNRQYEQVDNSSPAIIRFDSSASQDVNAKTALILGLVSIGLMLVGSALRANRGNEFAFGVGGLSFLAFVTTIVAGAFACIAEHFLSFSFALMAAVAAFFASFVIIDYIEVKRRIEQVFVLAYYLLIVLFFIFMSF